MSALHLAVAGKGGAGKSTLAGTLSRVLARRGQRVLALDSDMQPGLALSLGVRVPDPPPLTEAAERGEDGRWRLKPGVGPVRAIQRYATAAPDGVLLLQAGKTSPDGPGPRWMSANQAFFRVVHRLGRAPSLAGWAIVGDLPAGQRQVAFGWAPYAQRFLLVVEPTSQSMLTARRIARIATARRPVELVLAVNKVSAAGDVGRVEEHLGLTALAAVPTDDAVRAAERLGVALLDHAPDAPAVEAIDALAQRLRAGRLGRP